LPILIYSVLKERLKLISGAEPGKILSAVYADMKKYLTGKEKEHFSDIV